MRAYDVWTQAVSGVLALVAPRAAAVWRHRRGAYRAYAAASTTGPNGYWRPVNRSGDAELQRDFPTVLARARDLAQNNPYISGALVKITNNVVRQGIRPQYNLRMGDGKTPDKKRNDKIEAAWKRWSRRGVCDITGHDSIYGLQKIVLRHLWTDGECLVRRVYVNPESGELPLRIQLIECDQLDSSIDGLIGGSRFARRGIEMDPMTGRPTAYHLLESHPGDSTYSRPKTVRIPAEDIIHVFDRSRISMTRGVSWFAAIAMEMYDFSDYQNYERIGAKLAAAFGVFIKSQYPELFSGGINPLAGPGMTDASTGATTNDAVPDFIEPGRIQVLPPGTDIAVASHNRPGDSYEPYTRTSLRGTSAGLPMSYEAFSNDYTAATYSSARSATLEERLSYRGQQQLLNDQFNDGLTNWFLEALWMTEPGLLPNYAADAYRFQSAVSWQDPGWGWVDPYKDAKAAETELSLDINTRRNLAAQRGMDWDEIMDQAEREADRMITLAKKRAEIKMIDAGPVAPDGEPAEPQDRTTDFQAIKDLADAYGVSVRAGAITPQEPDETIFREKLGLPPMAEAVVKAWDNDDGVRRPITLKAGDAFTAEADAAVMSSTEDEQETEDNTDETPE